jgi:lipopolysaccharide transport system ATP-binding protein
MSSELAIRADGLSKAYTIRRTDIEHITLAELALDRLRHPLRRSAKDRFWALQDVSFDVRFGEVVGLIGPNGAGKSTLLKLLSRITGLTEGRIDLWGRVGSLLEVGTGFHPELTGRENIFLNGAVLGMTQREITRQFDAIVTFAGIERFLETPVKRYSSGMYVRLAFAVAAHLESEIMLVDEVLAVGDQQFQQRCIAKLREVALDGRAVVLVSHQMGTIKELCGNVLVLADGKVDFIGSVERGVERYLNSGAIPALGSESRRLGSGEVRIAEATVGGRAYEADEPKEIQVSLEQRAELPGPCYLAALIRDSDGAVAAHLDSRAHEAWFTGGSATWTLTLREPWLRPGSYSVDLSAHCHGTVDVVPAACRFEVVPSSPYSGLVPEADWSHTAVLADFSVVVQQAPTSDNVGRVLDAPSAATYRSGR